MSTLTIRKKSLKTWLHTDSILGDFIISKFYFNADNGNFQVVEQGQSKRVIYDVSDITLYDDTDGGIAETFANITALSLRLEELNYPAFQYDGQIVSIANLIEAGTNVTITGDGTEASPYVISSSGTGGGAVDSVNGQTGVVSIDLQSVLTEGNIATLPIDVGNIIASDVNGGESPLQLITSFVDTSPIVLFDTVTGNTASINLRSVLYNSAFWIPRILNGDFLMTELQTANFTAVNSVTYIANGTLTVTDSTPLTNSGYIVHVIGGSVTIGGVAYTSGALVYRYYDGASWISTNMNNPITIDATPTDGSSNAVSSNGVFDALAQRVKILSKSGTPTTTVTGTLTETEILKITIPANTMTTTDFLNIERIPFYRAGFNSAVTFRVKLSTSASMPATTTDQIAVNSITSANLVGSFSRCFWQSSGSIFGANNTAGALTDFTNIVGTISSKAFDPTVTNYLYVSVTLGNIADSIYLGGHIITV